VAPREVGHGLGQGQRRPLPRAEERRLPPGGQGVAALLGLAGRPGVLGAHVEAEGAAVELGRPELDQLAEHRVEPDDRWTLDTLAAADVLTSRAEGRFGFGTQWTTYQNLTAAIRCWGGELISLDGKQSMVDRPEALQAMQWHWELWHRRQTMLPKSIGPADFGASAIAMGGQMLAGACSNVKNAVKDGFRWSMVMMPNGCRGAIVQKGSRRHRAAHGWAGRAVGHRVYHWGRPHSGSGASTRGTALLLVDYQAPAAVCTALPGQGLLRPRPAGAGRPPSPRSGPPRPRPRAPRARPGGPYLEEYSAEGTA
jgi:hypothetical protein